MDYLYGTEYTMTQCDDMFHFGSDTELLGCFMDVKKQDRVLDIGTNNGALLFYASLSHPRELHGIDLYPEVIEVAKHNAKANNVEMTFDVCRLQDYTGDPYDLIVCNPPYFHTSDPRLKNANRYLLAARHEEYLNLDDLFSGVKRLLKSNGRFDMVYRPTDVFTVFNTASKYGLFCTRMRVAYASKKKRAKTVLLEFRFKENGETLIEAPVFLDDRSTFGHKEGV